MSILGENKNIFTNMEIDAIGEILNISMGASATTISTMLDKRVVITTPKVNVMQAIDFQFDSFEPAVAVEINYIEGLIGTNMMILKKTDVRAIVGLLLQTEITDESFELDEISNSAICEVMNQMMGSSSTAMAELLNRPVNISTPISFPIESSASFKAKYYKAETPIVAVCFHLSIEGVVESEFISVLSVDLCRELIRSFDESGFEEIEEEAVKETLNKPKPEIEPKTQGTKISGKFSDPKARYDVQKVEVRHFDNQQTNLSEEQSSNLQLIMSVPLQITVEIGRTKKQIKDILTFSPGSIIELDKQAGAHVDIFVNGQRVAKGDVVVVEEYYGVRISEIVSNSEIIKIL